MKSAQILEKASALVTGERDRQHGAKDANFRRIAIMWAAWLEAAHGVRIDLSGVDVGQMMSLLKKARTLSGQPNPDDWVDDAGYTACAGEIAAMGLTFGTPPSPEVPLKVVQPDDLRKPHHMAMEPEVPVCRPPPFTKR